MYSFTNRFSGPSLRERVLMMNSHRSGFSVWWRYGIWVLLMGAMAFACRHKQSRSEVVLNPTTLPATNPTRGLVVDLEDKQTWYRHMALFNNKFGTEVVVGKPVILQLKENRFVLPEDYKYSSAVYINGKEASVDALQKLSPDYVSELFVIHQWENFAEADQEAKPYQIMIQTSSQRIPNNDRREQFFSLLRAAAISQNPLGETRSFNMNQLLEATFFHNKNALVERTKNEHLSLYDEYAKSVDVFINNLPATPADVKTIHVREVARLYAKERPYLEWLRPDNPLSRFVLNIHTSPKRAKRDSTYYVFSPFYTGDF